MSQIMRQRAITDLTNILIDYAPNAEAQQAVSTMRVEIERNTETDDLIIKSLAGAIFDGLAYGNWPWTGTRISS
jgi:hypothetical protein